MTRAVATGWRLIAARATPALSTTRHATIAATAASGDGAAAANSAIFQVNWASRGRRAALGCTRTSCNTMPLPPGVAAHATGGWSVHGFVTPVGRGVWRARAPRNRRRTHARYDSTRALFCRVTSPISANPTAGSS
jgi:hypothetical protein